MEYIINNNLEDIMLEIYKCSDNIYNLSLVNIFSSKVFNNEMLWYFFCDNKDIDSSYKDEYYKQLMNRNISFNFTDICYICNKRCIHKKYGKSSWEGKYTSGNIYMKCLNLQLNKNIGNLYYIHNYTHNLCRKDFIIAQTCNIFQTINCRDLKSIIKALIFGKSNSYLFYKIRITESLCKYYGKSFEELTSFFEDFMNKDILVDRNDIVTNFWIIENKRKLINELIYIQEKLIINNAYDILKPMYLLHPYKFIFDESCLKETLYFDKLELCNI